MSQLQIALLSDRITWEHLADLVMTGLLTYLLLIRRKCRAVVFYCAVLSVKACLILVCFLWPKEQQ